MRPNKSERAWLRSFRIHPGGIPFVVVGVFLSLISLLVSWKLSIPCVVITAAFAYFFRDPERFSPEISGAIVSPADGIIVSIGAARPPEELGLEEGDWQKIGIFLDILDVHVIRTPSEGTVAKAEYRTGSFLNAARDEASHRNEHMSLLMNASAGARVAYVIIAGLIARRIVCDVKQGETFMRGARCGLVRFGSRVDVYVRTSEYFILAREGQRMVGGESLIALPRGFSIEDIVRK